ncbi:MaoC/PaaZ C-terminal domain-containing protein [Flavisphingomonas formosensis]|uniref:MaoC/PaaZ C-terminal domain-containing protein n=1 Tax=Flavisphingomonas formosensis TaxID=861534 RepID=UPI0012FAFEA1|nr:MaoC/PaaZ C-terminal domain-containing protein [Sphingomonas formosensis]
MVPYADLLAIRCPERLFSWSEREAMLYALGIGMAADPLDPHELPFVYEKNLKVMPSFATVAAWGSNPPLAAAKVDYTRVVHAEQGMTLHRAFPSSATIRAVGGMTAAIDKGDGGALIYGETELRDADTGEAYATLAVTWLARADGHFGGPRDGVSAPHMIPDRPAELSFDIATRPDQALLYRLSGDRNPLHADIDLARRSGFERPILHGLCTYGLCCRAVIAGWADYDPLRLVSQTARFSAPVLPGDTITVDMWRDEDVVSFEARVRARGVTVIRNGKAVLQAK